MIYVERTKYLHLQTIISKQVVTTRTNSFNIQWLCILLTDCI
jgi:hypothetical protein